MGEVHVTVTAEGEETPGLQQMICANCGEEIQGESVDLPVPSQKVCRPCYDALFEKVTLNCAPNPADVLKDIAEQMGLQMDPEWHRQLRDYCNEEVPITFPPLKPDQVEYLENIRKAGEGIDKDMRIGARPLADDTDGPARQ